MALLIALIAFGRGSAQEDSGFPPPESPGEAPSREVESFPWPLPSESFEAPKSLSGITESNVNEPTVSPPWGTPQMPLRNEPYVAPEMQKNMVEVPPSPERPFIDSGDFRDPFFPIRGFQENSPKVLEPGVTVDGLRFYSYADSDRFVENFYRNSNFALEDVFGRVVQAGSGGNCLNCHGGIEQISPNHKFRCNQCHKGNQGAKTMAGAHKGLVSNPSDLQHVDAFCGKCHADQIAKVKASSMATARKTINITRYAWGAQPFGKAVYSLLPNKKNKELSLPSGKKAHAVDGFLRTKCLRCHLQSPAPHRPGDYRATGCAACHMIYANDGASLTRDPAIQSKLRRETKESGGRFRRDQAARSLTASRGYPVIHKFTVAVPSVQCEHCHNNNGVGSEFEGLFQMPARPAPSRQSLDRAKPVLHGSEHEFLVPDIHRERGMHCIDCHGSEDLKAAAPKGSGSGVQIRCEDCHGSHNRGPEEFLLLKSDPNSKDIFERIGRNPNLARKIRSGDSILVGTQGAKMPHVKREKNQWVLFSKVTGNKHLVPVLKDIAPPPAHQIGKHMQGVECAACHARWSGGEWGMHLIREQAPDLSRWRDWSFSDPTLQHLLSEKDGKAPAKMLDWLTAKSTGQSIEGEWTDGVWWDIFSETGWSSMILGKNHRGKVSVMKPRYQYFYTERTTPNEPPAKRAAVFQTADGKPGMVLTPHTPHTIRKSVRSCESCHENEIARGLGDPGKRSILDAKSFLSGLLSDNKVPAEFQLKQVVTPQGESIQAAAPPNAARFLNPKEIAALGSKSNTYRMFRYFDLRHRQFPRLLTRSEFPYDARHKKNEALFGSPPPVEDMYYNLDRDEIVQPPAPQLPPPAPLVRRYEKFGPLGLPQPLEQSTPQPQARPFDEPGALRDAPAPQKEFSATPSVRRFEEFRPTPTTPEKDIEEAPPAVEPDGQALEEEGKSIIDFFQDIFQADPPAEGPPPIYDPSYE